MKHLSLFFLLLLYTLNAFSYVTSKSETGKDIKWTLAVDDLVIYVNPVPLGSSKTQDITSSDVMTILNESIDQWNNYSSSNLKAIYTTQLPASKNKLFFSSNTSYFGSGVLAITEINYNVETGAISSADIIINESAYNILTFTKQETESSYLQAYLGDVFTHELGHFLGLSHSEVIGSSMIYSVFKNQHTVHSDDYSGVLDIYNRKIDDGEFKGKVTGGGGNPVFGAQVMLLSSLDGKVLQAQISKEDGSFYFKNVPPDNSYYFYVTPTKQVSSISDYYSTVVNAFCQQGSYQGSFFTKCGPRSKSRPQGFELTSDNSIIDVGEITIRCDQNLDPNYLVNKNNTTSNRSFELNPDYRDFSQVFVGMFSPTEVENGTTGLGDEFTLDLRSLDFEGMDSALFKLKLEFLSTGIGSALDFEVGISLDGINYTNYNSNTDETGKTITDLTIDLNLGNASSNLFYIKVYPLGITSTQKYEIFSSSSNLTNKVSLYTINSQVGRYVSGRFVPFERYVSDSYDDNSSCREGTIDYATQAYTPLTAGYSSAQDDMKKGAIAGISCATIDLDDSSGPGSGGGMSFLVGFLLMLSLFHLKPHTYR